MDFIDQILKMAWGNAHGLRVISKRPQPTIIEIDSEHQSALVQGKFTFFLRGLSI
jgi:hypothetical protein